MKPCKIFMSFCQWCVALDLVIVYVDPKLDSFAFLQLTQWVYQLCSWQKYVCPRNCLTWVYFLKFYRLQSMTNNIYIVINLIGVSVIYI